MKIGTLLRKLRDSLRISSRDLVKKMEISHSTYMDWEHDKTSPSLRSFIKLANALEVDPVELLSYLTGQSSLVRSMEELENIVELRNMVGYLRNHNCVLMEDNQKVVAEIHKLRELQSRNNGTRQRDNSIL